MVIPFITAKKYTYITPYNEILFLLFNTYYNKQHEN
jgi:hypothetical protein